MPNKIQILALANNRAEILIHEPIGENWFGDGLTSKRFIDDLKALGDVTNIRVRINSNGGEVFTGIAIHNALRDHPAKIDVYVEGIAASIASVIAMAGDTITMGSGAMLMIHNPMTVALGNAEDMRKTAGMLDQVGEALTDIYEKRTGLKRQDIKDMLAAETFMTAAEAVRLGFADAQEEEVEDEAIAATRQSRVTAFKKFAASVAKASPSQIAAVLQSVKPDATIGVIDMPNPATASVQPTDIENAAQAAAQKAKADALAAESARRASIRNEVFVGPFAANHRDLMDTCMDDTSCTIDAARAKLLAELGKKSVPLGGHVEPGLDSRDKFVAGVSNAILARGNVEKIEAGNEFAGASLKRICRAVLQRSGVSHVDRLEGSQLASKVFAVMSTSDFPLLLGSTANKALRKAYEQVEPTWKIWAGIGSVSDFKSNFRGQLGSFNSLAVIPEGGEYKAGNLAEEGESIQAQTKGRYLSLTRQMIINDDLGVFVDRSTKLGFAAARTVNEDVYAKLVANPTMSDGGTLFNATAVTTVGGHANYTSSGTAISIASLAVGEGLMAAQKDNSLRTVLNLAPRYLLAPRGKRLIAWDVLNSPTDNTQSNPAKPNYARSMNLELVTDAALTGNGWYLVTDPNIAAVIEVAFLDGNQTPYTDETVDFMTDAMIMKVRLDYGVAAMDWRGGYFNAGA